MNNRFRKSGTSLFLMELMVAILFFSIASAVCMQLFARAHLIDLKTRNLNRAVAVSESILEGVRGCEDPMEGVRLLYPEASAEGTVSGKSDTASAVMTIYFDPEWNAVQDESAPFVCNVTINRNGSLLNTIVQIRDVEKSKELYSLSTAKYLNNQASSQ